MRNKDDNNLNPAESRRVEPPDPIIQAKDQPDKNKNQQNPSEALSVRRATPLADSHFMYTHSFRVPGTAAGQTIGELLESVFRFKWTIILIFILVTAPLTLIIWTQIVPKYRARAELQVRPIIPYLVYPTEDSGMIPLYTSFVNTQVSIIRSLTVLQRVLDQRDIQQTRWCQNQNETLFSRIKQNSSSALERLRDDLSVSPRSQTEIIDISFSASSSSEAKLIVDSILEQYIKYIGERSDETADELYRQLVDQYKALETEILGRENTIASLLKTLGTGSPDELVSNKRVQLNEVKVNIEQIEQNIALLQWQIDEISKQADTVDSNSVVASDANQPKYFEDPDWRQLDINVQTIEHNIINSDYTDKHPNMAKAKQDLEFAKDLLKQREEQLDEQWLIQSQNTTEVFDSNSPITNYSESLQGLQFQLSQANYKKELLTEEYNNIKTEFDNLFESAQLLSKENSELTYKKQLYDAVRARIEQKNMERNVPGTINVMMWGFVTSKPYNDRRLVFTVLVTGLGLCISVGTAFLRATKNQTVYAPKDIQHPVQLPFLGYIPLVNLKKSLGKGLSSEIKQKQFLLAESVRVMRTALLARLEKQGSAAILVTSSVAGTGKSSFTNTLGHSMAQAGKKVVMIDVDLHKRSLSQWHDLNSHPGFINALEDGYVEALHIYPTSTPNLHIIPSGEHSNGTIVFDEIAKNSFLNCIENLRDKYDIILLDSPPILAVADSVIMASRVDGVILVEREKLSHRGDIATATARLTSTGGHLFGFAFVSSMELPRNGYNGSYYYSANSD